MSDDADRLRRLAHAARQGDADALLRLVDALRGPVFAHAYTVLGSYDDAQDAVAPALLRIGRGVGRLRDPASLGAWVRRVARNEALRLRARRESAAPLLENAADHLHDDHALRLDIEAALRRLPHEQARVVWRFYIDRLSVAEIAAEVGAPEGTVKFWLHRARRRLADELEEYAPMSTQKHEAFIVHSEFTPEELTGLSDALRAAGWPAVRFVTTLPEAATLLRRAEGEPDGEVNRPRLIVVDDMLAGRSAFELFPLWNAAAKKTWTAVFLLATGGRPAAESDVTAMSAYLSGLDFLLTKPYDLREVESFARRAREQLEAQIEAAAATSSIP
jgi:RNA polymerase sigma-70 factor (ECF subfamily)